MRGDTGFPVRLRFSKRGKIRFISHRDVARALERAFRIVQLPLAFTGGFVPRPRVSFGHALSVGYESDAEYLDLELTTEVDVQALPAVLSAALPEGLTVTGSATLAERAPALQEAVTLLAYRIAVVDDPSPSPSHSVVTELVERAMTSSRLAVTHSRKGREVEDDIRPLVRHLTVSGGHDDGSVLDLEVITRPRSVRPTEVLAALSALTEGDVLAERRVLRTHQWIERDGARLEPLEADLRSRALEVRAL